MIKKIKKLFVLGCYLLLIACNNGGGSSNPEVTLTLETDLASFSQEIFSSDLANDLGIETNQINITETGELENEELERSVDGMYVKFEFVEIEGGKDPTELLDDIQEIIKDEGDIGGYAASIIIENYDGDCLFVTDCAGICNGNTHLDACGVCNGDGESCVPTLEGNWRVISITDYDNVECSGTPIWESISYNGEFTPNDDCTFCYDNGECDSYEVTDDDQLQEYWKIDISGEVMRLHQQWNYSENNQCNNWGYAQEDCTDGCSECASYTKDIRAISVSSVSLAWDDNTINDIENNNSKNWQYGTEDYESIICGESGEMTINYNGCLAYNTDDWLNEYNDDIYITAHEDETITYSFVDGNLIIKRLDFYTYYMPTTTNATDIINDTDIDEEFILPLCQIWELEAVTSLPSIDGCTDESSENYNPLATLDDESCEEEECPYSFQLFELLGFNYMTGSSNMPRMSTNIQPHVKINIPQGLWGLYDQLKYPDGFYRIIESY